MKYKYVWYVDTACDVITCRTLDDAIQTAEKYIKDREENLNGSTVLFWVLWVLLTAGLIAGFYTLENRWLY